MKIRNVVHKGLNRLCEDGDSRGLPPGCADKLRKMIAYLEAMKDLSELRTVPVWKAHMLTGGRKGVWSLHVTRNWRLTFWIDKDEREIFDIDFEDYH